MPDEQSTSVPGATTFGGTGTPDPNRIEALRVELARAERQAAEARSQARPAEPSQSDPYAPTQWAGDGGRDFVCPSGQRCRIKADLGKLIELGVLEKVNKLSSLVDIQVNQGNGQPPVKQLERILEDPKGMRDFFAILDKAVVAVVLAPSLHLPPQEGQKRVPTQVYVDSVSMGDRIAIFNEAFKGLADLGPFRGGSTEPPQPMANV